MILDYLIKLQKKLSLQFIYIYIGFKFNIYLFTHSTLINIFIFLILDKFDNKFWRPKNKKSGPNLTIKCHVFLRMTVHTLGSLAG